MTARTIDPLAEIVKRTPAATAGRPKPRRTAGIEERARMRRPSSDEGAAAAQSGGHRRGAPRARRPLRGMGGAAQSGGHRKGAAWRRIGGAA
jgi:hypothetical protein